MSQPQEIYRSQNNSADQILGSALRGISIEYKRTSTNIHLASANQPEVNSLLQALRQITKTRLAIRSHLETATGHSATDLLRDLVGDTEALRAHLWPEHYHSCEALTRLLDVLQSAQRRLPDC